MVTKKMIVASDYQIEYNFFLGTKVNSLDEMEKGGLFRMVTFS